MIAAAQNLNPSWFSGMLVEQMESNYPRENQEL